MRRGRHAQARFDRLGETMYIYIVVRTQIYLTRSIDTALGRVARKTGRTKSHLIRDAIEQVYIAAGGPTRIDDALTASAGAWKRRISGAKYVSRMRRGRLAKLHSSR